MSYEYSEDGLVEAASQEVLEDLGWVVEMAWHKEKLTHAEDKQRVKGLLGRIMEKMTVELEEAINVVQNFLQEVQFELNSTPPIQDSCGLLE